MSEVWIGGLADTLLAAMQSRARCWRDLATFVKSDWRTLSDWHQGKCGLDTKRAVMIFRWFNIPFTPPAEAEKANSQIGKNPVSAVTVYEIRKKPKVREIRYRHKGNNPEKIVLSDEDVAAIIYSMTQQKLAISRLAAMSGATSRRTKDWIAQRTKILPRVRERMLRSLGLDHLVERKESGE